MPVITSKNKIVVESSGHPASVRKMRCPRCRLGYAVESNVQKGVFTCSRCGASIKESTMG